MLKSEELIIENLYDFKGTLVDELLNQKEYPWEVLPIIGDFTLTLGKLLPEKEYTRICGKDGMKNVWISKTARIAEDANIYGPTIIGHGTELKHNALIRGKVIIGENCVIGNSTEIKNSILLNNVQAPHYNYIGDSILGNFTHLGAGVILSNLKSSKHEVYIGHEIATGLRKVGAFVGDYTEIGCNSVLNPGAIVGKHSIIYPLTCVVGVFPTKSTIKS